MKSIHITRMERLRSINLRIGFAAAILFAIFAFNWTTKRAPAPIFEEEAYPTEVALKPFTINQPRLQELPPATVLRPKDLIIEVPDLKIGLTPTIIPFTPSPTIPGEPGNVAPPAATILAKAATLRPEEPAGSVICFIVQNMPRFPGCEEADMTKKDREACATNQMLKYIYSHIRYPAIARDAGIEGTVYIKFVVEKDGSISNATVMRDIGGGCGEEALKVVNSMPKWIPGKQQGRPVRVQFSLPVKFKLT